MKNTRSQPGAGSTKSVRSPYRALTCAKLMMRESRVHPPPFFQTQARFVNGGCLHSPRGCVGSTATAFAAFKVRAGAYAHFKT